MAGSADPTLRDRTPAEVVADRLEAIEGKLDVVVTKLEGFEAALEDFGGLTEGLMQGGGLGSLVGAIFGGGTGRNGGDR